MATSIAERILDRLANRLATITAANGYETDGVTVWRATEDQRPMETTPPAVEIRHNGTPSEPHLRGALECVMEVDLLCVAAYDAAGENISDLIGDVIKLVLANKRWNDGTDNLAVRTWVGEAEPHETEVGEDPVTAVVPVFIKYRVDATNPFALKSI